MYSFDDKTLNITWPPTEPGMEVAEECLCHGPTNIQKVTRDCRRYSDGAVKWEDPDISQCPALRESTIRLCIALYSEVRLPDTECEAVYLMFSTHTGRSH